MWNTIDKNPNKIGTYVVISITKLGNQNVFKAKWNGKSFEGYTNQKITHWCDVNGILKNK